MEMVTVMGTVQLVYEKAGKIGQSRKNKLYVKGVKKTKVCRWFRFAQLAKGKKFRP